MTQPRPQKTVRITSGPITDLGVSIDDVVNRGSVKITGTRPGENIFLDGLGGEQTINYPEDARSVLPAVNEYLAGKDMYIARLQVVNSQVYSGDLYGPKTNEEKD